MQKRLDCLASNTVKIDLEPIILCYFFILFKANYFMLWIDGYYSAIKNLRLYLKLNNVVALGKSEGFITFKVKLN